MALVRVEHLGLDAAGGERLDAADAEQDLLAQAVLVVAAVEAVGHVALGRRVLGHVGVEQQQRHPADLDAPERGVQDAARERHCDPQTPSRRARAPCEREQRRVEIGELLLLGARGGQQLAEVAVAVEEPDPDERHAQVAGRLEVIAGEDPEAARVLRQRLPHAELGREVRDALGRDGQRVDESAPSRPRPARVGARRRSRKPASAASSSRRPGRRSRASRPGCRRPLRTPRGRPRAGRRPARHPRSRRDCAPGGRVRAGCQAGWMRSWTARVAGSFESPQGESLGRCGNCADDSERTARRAPPGTASVQVISGDGLPGRAG